MFLKRKNGTYRILINLILQIQNGRYIYKCVLEYPEVERANTQTLYARKQLNFLTKKTTKEYYGLMTSIAQKQKILKSSILKAIKKDRKELRDDYLKTNAETENITAWAKRHFISFSNPIKNEMIHRIEEWETKVKLEKLKKIDTSSIFVDEFIEKVNSFVLFIASGWAKVRRSEIIFCTRDIPSSISSIISSKSLLPSGISVRAICNAVFV